MVGEATIEHDLSDAGGLRAQRPVGQTVAASTAPLPSLFTPASVVLAATMVHQQHVDDLQREVLLERNTTGATRNGAMDLLRTRRWQMMRPLRRFVRCCSYEWRYLLLAGLAGLTQDLQPGRHTLALVGLRLAHGTDVGGDLADHFLVDTGR